MHGEITQVTPWASVITLLDESALLLMSDCSEKIPHMTFRCQVCMHLLSVWLCEEDSDAEI